MNYSELVEKGIAEERSPNLKRSEVFRIAAWRS